MPMMEIRMNGGVDAGTFSIVYLNYAFEESLNACYWLSIQQAALFRL